MGEYGRPGPTTVNVTHRGLHPSTVWFTEWEFVRVGNGIAVPGRRNQRVNGTEASVRFVRTATWSVMAPGTGRVWATPAWEGPGTLWCRPARCIRLGSSNTRPAPWECQYRGMAPNVNEFTVEQCGRDSTNGRTGTSKSAPGNRSNARPTVVSNTRRGTHPTTNSGPVRIDRNENNRSSPESNTNVRMSNGRNTEHQVHRQNARAGHRSTVT